ncbi:hypothetical protein DQ181_10690 [Enterococcus faecium]|nr:hypothetical protein [Enterococcus faecium]ROX46109.1 hypothetical protein EGW26_04950 [Enterococcus faecium]
MTANCSKDKKLNFYEGVTKNGHILFSNFYWTLTGSIYKKIATLKRQSTYLTFEGRFKIASL